MPLLFKIVFVCTLILDYHSFIEFDVIYGQALRKNRLLINCWLIHFIVHSVPRIVALITIMGVRISHNPWHTGFNAAKAIF